MLAAGSSTHGRKDKRSSFIIQTFAKQGSLAAWHGHLTAMHLTGKVGHQSSRAARRCCPCSTPVHSPVMIVTEFLWQGHRGLLFRVWLGRGVLTCDGRIWTLIRHELVCQSPQSLSCPLHLDTRLEHAAAVCGGMKLATTRRASVRGAWNAPELGTRATR